VHALDSDPPGPGGKDLRSTDVQPGSSTTIVASLKPGKTYEWYCPIDGHKGLGMKGTITVKAAGTGTGSPPTTSSGGSSGGGY
jgi:plastocyanin